MIGCRRIALAWITLMVLACASLSLIGDVAGAHLTFAAVIAVAAVKAMIVVWVYMRIGAAPPGWRIAFAGVIAAISAVILILHFAA